MAESNKRSEPKFIAILSGWLLFVIITILGFSAVSRLLIFALDDYLSAQDLSILFYFLISKLIFFVIGYLGFLISVKWVVFPFLYRNNNSDAKLSSVKVLFYEWLGCCFYFLVYCSPLLLIGRVPKQIIPEDIQGIISLIWVVAVSFVVYRSFFVTVVKGERLITSI